MGVAVAGGASWLVLRLGARWAGPPTDVAREPAGSLTELEVAVVLLALFAVVAGVMVAVMSAGALSPLGATGGHAVHVPRALWFPVLRSAAVGIVLAVFAGPGAGLGAFVLLASLGVMAARRRKSPRPPR